MARRTYGLSAAEKRMLGLVSVPRAKSGNGTRRALYKRLVAAWEKQYRSGGDNSDAIHAAGTGLINLGFESDVDKAMNEALEKSRAPKRVRKPRQAGGYVPCACRDCMEIAISGGKGKSFCSGCRDAGCPDYQGQPGMSQECQRADAYGG